MKSQAFNLSITSSKTYKHFIVPALPGNQPVTNTRKEFLYIGQDAVKIDFLIGAFESGYAPETLEKSFALLERLPGLSSRPDIIIFDSFLGETALNKLFCYLTSNSYYRNIPLVVEASALEEIEITKYKKLAFVDEIVFITREDKKKFIQKTDFLKKIKGSSGAQMPQLQLPYGYEAKWLPRAITKRAFDIVFSVLAILISLPVFLILALLIRIESKGPVFYISKRAGRGYKIFNFFKFRTMILDADKNVEELSHLNKYANYTGNAIFFKVPNDPRITRLGLFLRKTSLDELPQLFNVLIGDMSVVGNRPLPLFEAASLTTDEWAARFLAPAGMTGLWQIKKNDQGNMSVEERISLDIAYAHKYNFLYDLWIMANTPSALIQRSNS